MGVSFIGRYASHSGPERPRSLTPSLRSICLNHWILSALRAYMPPPNQGDGAHRRVRRNRHRVLPYRRWRGLRRDFGDATAPSITPARSDSGTGAAPVVGCGGMVAGVVELKTGTATRAWPMPCLPRPFEFARAVNHWTWAASKALDRMGRLLASARNIVADPASNHQMPPD
jgi:hypothetical protein